MAGTSTKFENKKFYEELEAAIEADKMYWIKNDAKLRAVATSKSYEEFRDIVAAAHLQPLTAKDKASKPRKWNSAFNGN